MNCQPCLEQKKRASATHWCKDCEEALCKDCTIQHKAFKLSKNHDVTILTERPNFAAGVLKSDTSNQTVCTKHPERGLEYLCPSHQIPICLFCKREDHKECLGVEKLEDAVDKEKISDMRHQVITSIENHISGLEKNLTDETLNSKCLMTEKERFFKTMISNRQELNDQLDNLEHIIKQEMIDGYQQKAKKIEHVIEQLNTEIDAAKKRLANLVLTYKDRPKPFGKRYLDLWRGRDVENALMEKNNELKTKSLDFPEYKFSYRLSEDKRELRVSHFVSTKTFKETLFVSAQDKITQDECGSSVVELEPDVEETQVPYKHESVSTQAYKSIKSPTLAMTETNILKQNSPETYAADSPKNSHAACSVYAPPNSHTACTVNSSPNKTFVNPVVSRTSFKLKRSFSINEGRNEFFSSDMKLMFCKFKLAVVDDRFPRFIMYTKAGQKIGCLKLPGKTDSIAVIDMHRAAVTLIRKESVAIVETERLSILSVICVNDECKGILFYNNKLIVNCTTDGLRYMTKTGQLIKCEESVAGDLYLHADKTGNIYSARLHFKTILVCDIDGRKQSTYNLRGLKEPYGLTSDRHKNLFVSCHETDKIFCKESLYSSAKVVLDQRDGINSPISIDYDDKNDELIIVNDNGISIYIFEIV